MNREEMGKIDGGPAKVSPIEERLIVLEEVINQAVHVTGLLIEKIGPVMSAKKISEEKEKNVESVRIDSEVACVLRAQAERVLSLKNFVQEAIDRVQL
jgi:hypothetical protein